MRLRTDDVSWQRIDDEIVVLDLRGSSYLRLNRSGALLWESLAPGAERDDLVRALAEGFDLDEVSAGHDVDAFLAELREAGLLAPAVPTD